MKNFFTTSAALCLATLSFSPSHAAFDPATLPADAKWAFHLDLDALRENPVGKELMVLIEKNAAIPLSGNIQIDVKKVVATLSSATAYGTTFSKNPDEIDGALLLQGTDELRKIAEGLAIQFSISNPELVTEIKNLPYTAYSIKGEVTVAFPKEPIILISRSKPQLQKTLDLYRGKTPAAHGPSTLKNLIPKTKTLLLLAATEVPNTDGLFPENAPQTRILKMASSASVAIGNDEKLTTACIQLMGTDEEMSEKLLKIVQGLTAMLSLTQSNDQQISEFLRSVKAERAGKAIVLNLAYPSERLATMIRDINTGTSTAKPNRHATPTQKPVGQNKMAGTWTTDDKTSENDTPIGAFRAHILENITLKNGTTIIISGRRENGEHARLDCVEVSPAEGGQPLRFEAENMKLSRYKAVKTPGASGGKTIQLDRSSPGHARFEFPGADGNYTLKIRYADEDTGKAVFTVTTQEPELLTTDEAEPTEDTANPAAK